MTYQSGNEWVCINEWAYINLEMNEFLTTKTIWIAWTAKDDKFSFRYSPPDETLDYTKRNILRCTATIFNSTVFLSPFIFLAKLMMQEAWVQGLN